MSRKKTEELLSLLRKRVLGPEGQGARAVFLEEVSDSTGFGGKRRADAISVGMWPSRGCLVEGYELKVSRGDWLGELRDPSKAEATARYCDRFWLVTLPGLVEAGELPTTWGLLEKSKNGRGLSCVREGPKLDREPMPSTFLASVLRRAVTADVRDEARKARKEAEWEAEEKYKRPKQRAEQRLSSVEEQRDRLRELYREFEDALGVPLRRWLDREKREVRIVGEVARELMEADVTDLGSRVKGEIKRMDEIREHLAKASALLDAEAE